MRKEKTRKKGEKSRKIPGKQIFKTPNKEKKTPNKNEQDRFFNKNYRKLKQQIKR
jgi:hypothetical protein